jgi:hypothetical protein
MKAPYESTDDEYASKKKNYITLSTRNYDVTNGEFHVMEYSTVEMI